MKDSGKQHDLKATLCWALIGLVLILISAFTLIRLNIFVSEVLAGSITGYALVHDGLLRNKAQRSKTAKNFQHGIGIVGVVAGMIGQLMGGSFSDVVVAFVGGFFFMFGLYGYYRISRLPDNFYQTLEIQKAAK